MLCSIVSSTWKSSKSWITKIRVKFFWSEILTFKKLKSESLKVLTLNGFECLLLASLCHAKLERWHSEFFGQLFFCQNGRWQFASFVWVSATLNFLHLHFCSETSFVQRIKSAHETETKFVPNYILNKSNFSVTKLCIYFNSILWNSAHNLRMKFKSVNSHLILWNFVQYRKISSW
jgi:hypothetical protein